MKKINFKEFPVKKHMTGKETIGTDIRESFADLIYSNVNGIKALNLAQKIYNSEGETEFDENEIGLMMNVAENLCVAKIIDSLQAIIE